MNYKSIVSILLVCLFSSLTACKVEGEQIIGIWQTNGDMGQMKIEILPWNSKFNGYMLEYKDGKNVVKGERTEDYIMLTDLVYQNDAYENGTIYIDQSGDEKCGIRLQIVDEHQLTAIYNCQGEQYKETWTRAGHTATQVSKNEESPNEQNSSLGTTNADTETTNTAIKAPSTPKKPSAKKADSSPNAAKKGEHLDTKRQGTFYVIGVHRVVDYNNTAALAKAVEALWTQTYDNDFSGKLGNITDQESMYAVYSNYDQPKGKMTITIGYKVKDLSNVPAGLKGVKVPTNDYLTYAMSGEASDYEGEGWEQLEEMMAYRKVSSADFEVYTFDNNYEVTSGTMWIATK